MNMQDVSNLVIPEGNVRTIHDSSNNQLWGKVAYDTKYKGDTTQRTYTGKNLWDFTGINPTSGANFTSSFENGILSVSWTGGFDLFPTNGTAGDVSLDSTKTYTLSVKVKGSPLVFKVRGGSEIFRTTTTTEYTQFSGSFTNVNSLRIDIIRLQSTSGSANIKELQLEEGSTATSYEPYTAGPAPNPDYPQTVSVVTGTQTLTLGDGVNSYDYTLSLGSVELCKIDSYQDYIYKSGDDWYAHKKCASILVNGTQNMSFHNNRNNIDGYRLYFTSNIMGGTQVYSERFIYQDWDNYQATPDTRKYSVVSTAQSALNNVYITFKDNTMTTASDFQTWFSNNNTLFYYVLATATDTQITDATLVGQLNAVHQWLTRYGYSAAVAGNLPIIVDRTAL